MTTTSGLDDTDGTGDTMSLGSAPLTIRAMTPDDIDAVATIEHRVAPRPWSRQLFAGEFTVGSAHRHWLVATTAAHGVGSGRCNGRDVIGFAGAMLVADEAHIMNIAVDPRHRRHGVARRLLARLLLDVGDRGAITATLEVDPTNRAALQLYRAFHFVDRGRRPGYYGDGRDALILIGPSLYRPEVRSLLVSQAATSTNGDRP